MDLAPPPYVYNEFFTNLTKRFHATGYRMLQASSGIANIPSSPSPSVPALAGQNHTLFTPEGFPLEMDLFWPIKSLVVLLSFLAGGGILLFMYRKVSKPEKVESCPVRSVESSNITQRPLEGEYAGLRRRPRRALSKDPDLSNREFSTDDWHGDCSADLKSMQDYVMELSGTASVPQVEYNPND